MRYDQFTTGYRTGIEPVLLAASVPARCGQCVIEAGAGAGAGLLCLAARVPGITGLGVERDPALAVLARRNAAANGWDDTLIFLAAAIEQTRPLARFDHAMANPPWHEARGTRSPDPGRDGAKRATDDLLAGWTTALAAMLRPGGTLTLVLPAALLDRAIVCLRGAGCGSLALLPLWPRAGVPARLGLLQARRGGSGGFRLNPGLVLHGAAGPFTEAAEAVLRHGAGLTV